MSSGSLAWLYGILQQYGVYKEDMSGNPDKAFKALEELRKSGKLSESDAKIVNERTGGKGASKPGKQTKVISDTVKKHRAMGITVRDPRVYARAPDSELCKGDVEPEEIRLPKTTDKPDEDTRGLPPAEQLKKLYGKEFTGLKGTAAIKKLLMERKGHVKGAAHTTLVIDGKREEISVDYVWGNNKLGIKHLIADRADALMNPENNKNPKTPAEARKHIAELLNNITESIEKGTALNGANHTGDLLIDYRPRKTTLIIGRSYEGQEVTYLLTGFKRRRLTGNNKKPPQ